MSNDVLVIVPPEWKSIDVDQMAGLIGYTVANFEELQGRSAFDLNERLRPTGFLPEGMRVLDVFVVNGQVFFKYEADLD